MDVDQMVSTQRGMVDLGRERLLGKGKIEDDSKMRKGWRVEGEGWWRPGFNGGDLRLEEWGVCYGVSVSVLLI